MQKFLCKWWLCNVSCRYALSTRRKTTADYTCCSKTKFVIMYMGFFKCVGQPSRLQGVQNLINYNFLYHFRRFTAQLTAAFYLHSSTKFFRNFLWMTGKLRKNFTIDNGNEFCVHKALIVITGMPVYFCDPY